MATPANDLVGLLRFADRKLQQYGVTCGLSGDWIADVRDELRAMIEMPQSEGAVLGAT